MAVKRELWKVGELAKRTGMTIRTLHHYDRIGLLSPSRHSESGHRLYTETDIAMLQRIVSLKQLGFGLEEIGQLIRSPRFNASELIRLQLERLNEQIRLQEALRERLERLDAMLGAREEVTAEQLIQIIEAINMNEANQYFTAEQLEAIKKRGDLLPPEQQKAMAEEWPVLLGSLRAELAKGTPPENPAAQKLAQRWKKLTDLVSGGDPAIVRASEQYYANHPDAAAQFGMDVKVYDYIRRALAKQ
ncbi:MerR family transcriptional regulator [Paenibacillus humicola]|uniref:MerR family transcriptional regulator n=1 Tax=Paenibacillus humicola TaxID=3110540 RepID=UPI00237C2870|nr:MerR family transcriptional regulator [Paenibacillus humicola]